MLTRQMFSSIVKGFLTRLSLSEGNYNTHSFRIGAATAAMEAQIPEAHIKCWDGGVATHTSFTYEHRQKNSPSYPGSWYLEPPP